MDFKVVLGLVLKEFNKEKVRYGLIGGFALGSMGVVRATIDLDFLVHRDDLDKIDSIMKAKGYNRVYRSENVSQYVSGAKIFGEVDFIHAFREISLGMLERAEEKEVFEGKYKIKVLKPEDIIGLKVQAVENDSARAAQDFMDIEALMQHYGSKLDWGRIEEYFGIFNRNEKFLELKNKYCNVK